MFCVTSQPQRPAVRASRAIKISSTYYDVSHLRNFLINPAQQSPSWNPHFSIADYWRKISLPQKTSGAGGRARGQISKFVFISQVMQHVARMCRRRRRHPRSRIRSHVCEIKRLLSARSQLRRLNFDFAPCFITFCTSPCWGISRNEK